MRNFSLEAAEHAALALGLPDPVLELDGAMEAAVTGGLNEALAAERPGLGVRRASHGWSVWQPIRSGELIGNALDIGYGAGSLLVGELVIPLDDPNCFRKVAARVIKDAGVRVGDVMFPFSHPRSLKRAAEHELFLNVFPEGM